MSNKLSHRRRQLYPPVVCKGPKPLPPRPPEPKITVAFAFPAGPFHVGVPAILGFTITGLPPYNGVTFNISYAAGPPYWTGPETALEGSLNPSTYTPASATDNANLTMVATAHDGAWNSQTHTYVVLP